MIIDFRVRPPYKSFIDTHLFAKRNPNPDPVTVNGLMKDMPPYRSFDERSMDAFLAEMDEAQIDLGVVVGRCAPPPFNGVENEDIAELIAAYPDRLVGVGAVDVLGDDAVAEVERLAERGFKGVAFDNPWWGIYDDDERLYPIYEKAAEIGLFAIFTSSIFLGPDMSYSDPIHLQRVARDFGNWKMVISHGCWPWTTNVCGIAFQHTNIYLMPDLYLNIPNTPGADEYVKAANYYLGYRLIHASSYPVRPLGESLEMFKQLPFASDEIRDRCLGENAARLLGLSG